ncbi:hypothetical protein [Nonomuraea dietziae]
MAQQAIPPNKRCPLTRAELITIALTAAAILITIPSCLVALSILLAR